MAQVLLNNTSTKLAAAVAVSDTTITVTAGDGVKFILAVAPATIRATLVKISGYREIAWEIVDITARSTDTLTITRARESTTALTFAIGDVLDVRLTAGFDLTAMSGVTLTGTQTLTNKTLTAPIVGTATQGANTTVAASTAFVMGEFNKHKNIIHNGGFTVNQRTYVSAAALASGAYGHDRWKGGASGGDYTFTQLASNTTITIAANKTLIQVIEDKDVQATAYVLSWTGTAQARYAVNSATPAGAYAASPILITGQTVGTTMSIEFSLGASAGTVGNVQLEIGNTATAFEYRPYQQEYDLCRRFYRRISSNAGNTVYIAASANYSTTNAMCSGETAANMRVMPTVGYSAIGDLGIFTAGSSFTASAISIATIPIESPNITVTTASAWTTGDAGRLYILSGTGKYIEFKADL